MTRSVYRGQRLELVGNLKQLLLRVASRRKLALHCLGGFPSLLFKKLFPLLRALMLPRLVLRMEHNMCLYCHSLWLESQGVHPLGSLWALV